MIFFYKESKSKTIFCGEGGGGFGGLELVIFWEGVGVGRGWGLG